MNILLFVAILLILLLSAAIGIGIYLSPSFKGLIYNVFITLGANLGLNQLYWKQPAIWFSKEGNTSGNTIYKQTYTCGKGVDYKKCIKAAKVEQGVELPPNKSIGEYTNSNCDNQCLFNVQTSHADRVINLIETLVSQMAIMGVTAVAVEMVVRRIIGLSLKIAETAVMAAAGRLAVKGLEKVGMEITEMLMFADLGPVGWAIDAAMAMGMIMSFWDPDNMSEALFNRSIVLPQRNNLENSMQLMCKNRNIINPPLFPLEYLSFGESYENFNKRRKRK